MITYEKHIVPALARKIGTFFALLGIISCGNYGNVLESLEPSSSSVPESTTVDEGTLDGLRLSEARIPTRLAGGSRHTCFLRSTGSVRCWGNAYYGQLGYGNTEDIGDDETPASAGDVPLGGKVVQVSSGRNHICALLSTGNVRCWGSNSLGQLGYMGGDFVGRETPQSLGDVPIGEKVAGIEASGWGHVCAILTTGAVRCWGYNSQGQLGYGHKENIGDDETPASVGDVPLGDVTVTQLALGLYHTCALLDTGDLRCWGLNRAGQLGYGHTDNIGDDETPASVDNVPIGGKVIEVVAGHYHTCALLQTGAVRCWGAGASGQLGYGNKEQVGDNEVPSDVGDVQVN